MQLSKDFFEHYERLFKIEKFKDYFNPMFTIFFKNTNIELQKILTELIEKEDDVLDLDSEELKPFRNELKWNPLKALIYIHYHYVNNGFPIDFMEIYIGLTEKEIYNIGKYVPIEESTIDNLIKEYDSEDFLEKHKDVIQELFTLSFMCIDLEPEEFGYFNKFLSKELVILDNEILKEIYEKVYRTNYLNLMPKAYHIFNYDSEFGELNILEQIHGETNLVERMIDEKFKTSLTSKDEKSSFEKIVEQIKNLVYDF